MNTKANEFVWKTLDGRSCDINSVDNSHLANIIRHIAMSPKGWYAPVRDEILDKLHREAERRGITAEELDSATGEFIDKDGKKKRFSYEERKYVEVD